MRLTRMTEIAIGILVACTKAKGRVCRTNDIAVVCGTSSDHAAQAVSRLRRLGWLESHRGRGGGVTLAEDAQNLAIGKIIRVFQPASPRYTDLPIEVGTPAIVVVLQEAEQSWLACFDRITIADLADERALICPGSGPWTGRSHDVGTVSTRASVAANGSSAWS